MPILRGADLGVRAGELVAIVGPNGAGKSTLVRAVSGMQKPSAGRVLWSGRELGEMRGRELARRRAFVPQRMPVPNGVSVREAVTIGRSSHLKPLRRLTGEDRDGVERGDGTGPRHPLRRARPHHSLRRRAAARADRDRPRPGGAGPDRRRAHLPARPRRHDRRRRPAARPRRRRVWRCCWSSTTSPWRRRSPTPSSSSPRAAPLPAELPSRCLTSERLAAVWGAEAHLTADDGRTALHVAWLQKGDVRAP